MQPDILWSDGEADADVSYWRSLEFLAWLYTSSPVTRTVVTNDRWGRGTQCHHGDFFTCGDRNNPRKLLKHKWENALTLDRSEQGPSIQEAKSPLKHTLKDNSLFYLSISILVG